MTRPLPMLGLAAAVLAAAPAVGAPLRLADVFEHTEAGTSIVALVAPLPGSSSRAGVAVVCDPAPMVRLQFGGFPAGRPVQARLTAPDGTVVTYGRPLVGQGPRSGFHIAEISDPPTMRNFVRGFFASGARLGDGNVSMANGLTDARNRELADRLLACLPAR